MEKKKYPKKKIKIPFKEDSFDIDETMRLFKPKDKVSRSDVEFIFEVFAFTKEFLGIGISQIMTKVHRPPIMQAKSLVNYFLMTRTGLSYATIGFFLGGKDHSTVIHLFDSPHQKFLSIETYQEHFRVFRNHFSKYPLTLMRRKKRIREVVEKYEGSNPGFQLPPVVVIRNIIHPVKPSNEGLVVEKSHLESKCRTFLDSLGLKNFDHIIEKFLMCEKLEKIQIDEKIDLEKAVALLLEIMDMKVPSVNLKKLVLKIAA